MIASTLKTDDARLDCRRFVIVVVDCCALWSHSEACEDEGGWRKSSRTQWGTLPSRLECEKEVIFHTSFGILFLICCC